MNDNDIKEKFLLNCLNNMKKKQEKLMKNYNFGNKNNKFMLIPQKSLFYMYDSQTNNVFLEGKIQIIGTYSDKSKTWRWGWSNRFVEHNMKKTALKMLQFGKNNKIKILTEPKIKDKNLAYIFISIGMKLSNGKGFYIIPGTKVYPNIYLIFTNIKKINKTYDDLIKFNKNLKYKLKKTNKNILNMKPKKLTKKHKKKPIQIQKDKFKNKK